MDIAAAKYVSFTSIRKNGVPVSTPVWIAPLADGRVGFTTDPDVGKVKRVRNNPAVTLQPCDMRGKVAPGAPTFVGRAEIVTGSGHDEVWRAVRRKYRIIANAMHVWSKVRQVIRRSSAVPTAILITLDSPA